MRKPAKISILLMSMCVLFPAVLSGCGGQSVQYGEDVIQGMIMSRFDRQNDVYYELGQQVENYLSGDRAIEGEKFSSLCLGVNCFVRDETNVGWADLCQDDQEVLAVMEDLMAATAEYRLDELRLSALSDDDLEKLADCFYELGDCCDRGIEESFAYHVYNQEFEGEAYQSAQDRVEELLLAVGRITA